MGDISAWLRRVLIVVALLSAVMALDWLLLKGARSRPVVLKAGHTHVVAPVYLPGIGANA